jgi:hypothetical protein
MQYKKDSLLSQWNTFPDESINWPIPYAIVEGLEPSTLYCFRVRARCGQYYGPWSAISKISTRSSEVRRITSNSPATVKMASGDRSSDDVPGRTAMRTISWKVASELEDITNILDEIRSTFDLTPLTAIPDGASHHTIEKTQPLCPRSDENRANEREAPIDSATR